MNVQRRPAEPGVVEGHDRAQPLVLHQHVAWLAGAVRRLACFAPHPPFGIDREARLRGDRSFARPTGRFGHRAVFLAVGREPIEDLVVAPFAEEGSGIGRPAFGVRGGGPNRGAFVEHFDDHADAAVGVIADVGCTFSGAFEGGRKRCPARRLPERTGPVEAIGDPPRRDFGRAGWAGEARDRGRGVGRSSFEARQQRTATRPAPVRMMDLGFNASLLFVDHG